MMKSMRVTTEVEKCTGNLKQQFISPLASRQKHKLFSAAQAAGCIELAFYRGQHSERYRIYKLLKKCPDVVVYLKRIYEDE